MNSNPHELPEQFPQKIEALAQLTAHDPAFAALRSDYEKVNAEIWLGETNIEPMDDFRLETLKKQRVSLLDAIATRLAAA